jgi:tetratricopeptide (TPR) repeat protein
MAWHNIGNAMFSFLSPGVDSFCGGHVKDDHDNDRMTLLMPLKLWSEAMLIAVSAVSAEGAAVPPRSDDWRKLLSMLDPAEALESAARHASTSSELALALGNKAVVLASRIAGVVDAEGPSSPATEAAVALALSTYHTALLHDPEHTDTYYNLGVLLAHQGDQQGAISAYSQAVTFDPTHARALTNLGVAITSSGGDMLEAASAHRRAVAADPKYASAHYNLGVVLGRLGEWESSIAAYNAAVKLRPNDAAAMSNLGAVLVTLGRTRDALEMFKAAVVADPTFAPAVQNLRVLKRKADADGVMHDGTR